MHIRDVILIEVMEWDFRQRSDAAVAKAHAPPRGNQVLLLRSKTGNQVRFVYEPLDVTTPTGLTKRVYHSELLSLVGSSKWSPMMLQEYARAAGFHFIGIKTFEEWLTEITGRVQKAVAKVVKKPPSKK